MVHAARLKKVDLAPFRECILGAAESIHAWLTRKLDQERMFDAVGAIAEKMVDAEHGGHTARAFAELNTLRKGVTRAGVISRTGFLPIGYSLLEAILTLCFLLLIVSHFKHRISEIVIVTFVALMYNYMYRLIRAIDDPFSFAPGGLRGTADVELFPLIEFIDRLKKKTALASSARPVEQLPS
jgi:hypothetical protein